MLSVDETIQRVERLYSNITGREPEPVRPDVAYAAIPPEKDPVAHVEEAIARLNAMLGLGRASVPSAQVVQPVAPWSPRVDLLENGVELYVLCDLPGVDRSSVRVTVRGPLLEISGERLPPPSGPSAPVMRRGERPTGRFHRVVMLGPNTRLEECTARLQEGVLTVTVPKGTPVASEARAIEIG
jgi:HSP20 family protein